MRAHFEPCKWTPNARAADDAIEMMTYDVPPGNYLVYAYLTIWSNPEPGDSGAPLRWVCEIKHDGNWIAGTQITLSDRRGAAGNLSMMGGAAATSPGAIWANISQAGSGAPGDESGTDIWGGMWIVEIDSFF